MKYEKYKDLYTQFLISEKNLSRISVNNYLVDLEQFFSTKDTKVSNLNTRIKSYIATLRNKNFKTSSINRKISALKNFLKFLHTEKIIEQILDLLDLIFNINFILSETKKTSKLLMEINRLRILIIINLVNLKFQLNLIYYNSS